MMFMCCVMHDHMVKQVPPLVMTLTMLSSTSSAYECQQKHTNEEGSMLDLLAFCRLAGMKSQTSVLALKASLGACACCCIRPLPWGHGQTG